MSKFDYYLDNIDAHIEGGMPFDGNVIPNPKQWETFNPLGANPDFWEENFWESING